jgi:PST family polysaccharide transporter
MEYLNSAIGGVAFSKLSQLQDDPARMKSDFLKGYLAVSMTLLITIFSTPFADEIIHVLFGPNWAKAAIIFRLLTPTVLIFGMINPLAWLLLSIGLQARSLKIAPAIAPIVITISSDCLTGRPALHRPIRPHDAMACSPTLSGASTAR